MSENHKGEVTYVIRADDEHIEADLEKSYQKVEQAAQKSADKTVEIEKEKTQEIKQEFDKVENSAKSTSAKVEKSWENAAKDIEDAFEDVGSEIGESSEDIQREVADIENANKKASEDVKSFWQKATEKIKKVFKKTSEDVQKDTKETGNAFENVSGAIKESLSDAATGAVPLLGQIEKLTAGLTATKAAALGIGVVFAGVAVAGVNAATDMDTAMNDFIASTGKGVEETERYQQVLEDIYANNYGENFQDIADAMAQVEKNLGEMSDESLQNVTESAYALRDTFEYEINESTRAAKALMDNFGVSGEDAMSMIAAGAQNGLDYSGELLDSISEYSVQFEKLGFSADDMFKVFEEGAESGAWNLDKIGDAVKEFSIRAIDGSDSTREGFELLGLNADEVAEKFAQGGESAKEAFKDTLEALSALEDPLEQNIAGADLFGTMWEDLGPEVVTALADIEEGAYDTADAMNEIKEVKYDDLQSMLEGLKRNVELLIVPIGEALIPLLSMLIESVLPILTNLLGPLIDLFTALLSPILDVISAGIKPLIDILNWLIVNAIEPLIQIISAVLVPLFSGSLESMFSSASSVIGNIINSFKNLLSFIKNVFTGNWKGAWTNIKNIFSSAVNAWSTIFKAPINTIVDGWNKLVSSLGKLKIPNWVPIVGGKSFSLPKMKRLKVGLDYVPQDMFPAYLDEGEWVLTKEEANTLRSLGGIEGIMALMADRNGFNGGIQSVFKNAETKREITIHTHVDLDGKEVGYSVTPFVDANMAIDEELKERGN